MSQSEAGGKVTREEMASAIVSATNEVFATMLDLEISGGQVQEESASSSRASGVVALLGLAGEWVGNGRICCTPEFGCRIASQLLMQPLTAVNEEVLDAVGEVANMIIGNIKNGLEERLGQLSLSTPTVIYGHNFEARSVGVRERITLAFESGAEQLLVQISLSPAASKAAPRSHVHDSISTLA